MFSSLKLVIVRLLGVAPKLRLLTQHEHPTTKLKKKDPRIDHEKILIP